jgi:hypothetical protein
MEVEQNRVRILYGRKRREGDIFKIFTESIGPYSGTVYQTSNIMENCYTIWYF